MVKKHLGLRISALRRLRKMSQETFAEKTGYSVDFISLVERGINAPTVDGCDRMANVLGVTIKDLFDFNSKIPDSKQPRKKPSQSAKKTTMKRPHVKTKRKSDRKK